MIKKAIKGVLIILLSAVLNMPACFADTQIAVDLSNNSNIEEISENNQKKSPSKQEAKHVFGKFFQTMLLVAGSCVAIFLLLIFYKNITTKNKTTKRNIAIEKDLETPETLDDAIKLFIEKF